MLNLNKTANIDQNTANSQSNNVNPAETSTIQSTTACYNISRRKLMWIIFSSIVVILIILGIVIPTTIIIKKEVDTSKTVSIATTTVATTTATTVIATTARTRTTTTTEKQMNHSITVSVDTKWKQSGKSIAYRYAPSVEISSFRGICLDDDDEQTIYITDRESHRIVEWNYYSKIGQVIAGGNGNGNDLNQLNFPLDVIIDKNNDSLIICDNKNNRILRWPRRNGTYGEIIISNVDCGGLTMDNNGDLYVSDSTKNEVRRWKIGDKYGTLVAGGNGEGNLLNQLNYSSLIFVDQNYSVYVSDSGNHRVMKWMKGANEGIIVAGGQGPGNSLKQLIYPLGIIVDQFESVYVSDSFNGRIMRWLKGSKEGSIVVGGNGIGAQSDQLNFPNDILFDRGYNLFVADTNNYHVSKFNIDLN